MSKIGKKILKGAREAAAYASGKPVKGVIVHHVAVPEYVDVKAIRKRLGMTQPAFAQTFGFSVSSLKKWETGMREPEAAARVLLRTIDHSPQTVIDANQPR